MNFLDSPPPRSRPFTESEFGLYARSDNLASLRRSHSRNVQLLGQGAGYVPNMLAVDPDDRTATLAASALQADLTVALGWHVHDDGTRILVQDASQKIQISLHFLHHPDRNIDQMLNDLQTQIRQAYENPEFKRFVHQDISLLMVRRIHQNNEPIEHVHLLTGWIRDTSILRAQVTVDASSRRYAVNYACLILKNAIHCLTPRLNRRPEPDGPLWWQRAQWLERQDRLPEAEQTIHNGSPSIFCAIQIAEMYRLRWNRLRATDSAARSEARQQAANWARAHASRATSGGEAAALSIERDEFLAQLGPEPLD
ncbi:MAG: hypothetical protein NTV52_04080 [Acidobacteria bacterium]|nr:hypothetical protein [Acidobacteriota bacterium]